MILDEYNKDIRNSSDENVIVHVDFAENYVCKYQDEVQASHWNQAQLTIFTCCLWNSQVNSIVCVSDNLKHDKTTAMDYLCTILDNYLGSESKVLTVWSDGPVSQFKNKFIVNSIKKLKERYRLNGVKWKYFATAHGKGAVDGIGGCIKKKVFNNVKSRRSVVRNAEEFVESAKRDGTKINILSGNEIKKNDILMLDVDAIKNITKVHFVKYFEKLELFNHC